MPAKRLSFGSVMFWLGLVLLSGASCFFLFHEAWALALGPWVISAPAILGRELRLRWVHLLGVGFMLLVGCFLLLVGASWHDSDTPGLSYSGLGRSMGRLSMALGLVLALVGVLLSFPGETAEDDAAQRTHPPS